MPRRVPIPTSLQHTPFSVADARAAGLGEGRLAGHDLARPFHGVRAVHAPATLVNRCRALVPRLRPGECFSHFTAAALWGCPFPQSQGADASLHVTGTVRAARARGVVGHQVARTPASALRSGLPVVDPSDLFRQLAPLLELDDLVAVADHLVLMPAVFDPSDIRPYLDLDALRVATVGSYRGAITARKAIEFTRRGAESRPETLLRLLLRRAGLPEPAVNPDITGKGWRYRVDLVFEEWKVAVEYDGDQHRTDAAQYERDIRRFDDLAEAGWIVIRVRKYGLFVTPQDTIARVRRALESRGWHAA